MHGSLMYRDNRLSGYDAATFSRNPFWDVVVFPGRIQWMFSMNSVIPHWPSEKSMSVIYRPSSVEEHTCQWDWYASAIRWRQEVYIHTVAKVTVLQQLLALKG